MKQQSNAKIGMCHFSCIALYAVDKILSLPNVISIFIYWLKTEISDNLFVLLFVFQELFIAFTFHFYNALGILEGDRGLFKAYFYASVYL